jgi:hypothetical protein
MHRAMSMSVLDEIHAKCLVKKTGAIEIARAKDDKIRDQRHSGHGTFLEQTIAIR